MPQWKACVQEIGGAGEVWHSDVTGETETGALRKALEIFLNTEDRYGVALDFTTLTMLRRRGSRGKRRFSVLSPTRASCPHRALRELAEGTA
jgi:hypothetical protein